MKALVLEKPDQYPVLKDRDLTMDKGKAQVKIKAAALNHRDVWITRGLYPGIKYPVVLGSDGAGDFEGNRVVINPSHFWGDEETYQSPDYQILGLPEDGTFAEYVSVERKYVHEMPTHLSYEQAAALPLAGLTAFRALISRAKMGKGDRVFINGIGGGVALFAFQFSLALGNDVFVSSGDDQKIEKAISIGAGGGVNYHKENWSKELLKTSGKGFDVLIDGAGGDGFSHLIRLANPGARISVYGGTQGAISSLNTQQIFWKQLSILGSTMGSENDFGQMLAFVQKHRIVPMVDSIFNLEESDAAFERMDKGKQFGKIVFSI